MTLMYVSRPRWLLCFLCQASYPVGSTVKVQVEEVKSDGKMVLSMKMENRAEVRYSNSGVRVDDALCVCVFSMSPWRRLTKPRPPLPVPVVRRWGPSAASPRRSG
jgi:hypothetical protein